MDQTVDQIEADIDRARERLGSNLRELEQKVEAATDWREQYRGHAWVVLGGAALLGFALARMVASAPAVDVDSLGAFPGDFAQARLPAGKTRLPHHQFAQLADDVAEALVGVASSQVKNLIAGIVPGFEEHLARAGQPGAPRY